MSRYARHQPPGALGESYKPLLAGRVLATGSAARKAGLQSRIFSHLRQLVRLARQVLKVSQASIGRHRKRRSWSGKKRVDQVVGDRWYISESGVYPARFNRIVALLSFALGVAKWNVRCSRSALFSSPATGLSSRLRGAAQPGRCVKARSSPSTPAVVGWSPKCAFETASRRQVARPIGQV